MYSVSADYQPPITRPEADCVIDVHSAGVCNTVSGLFTPADCQSAAASQYICNVILPDIGAVKCVAATQVDMRQISPDSLQIVELFSDNRKEVHDVISLEICQAAVNSCDTIAVFSGRQPDPTPSLHGCERDVICTNDVSRDNLTCADEFSTTETQVCVIDGQGVRCTASECSRVSVQCGSDVSLAQMDEYASLINQLSFIATAGGQFRSVDLHDLGFWLSGQVSTSDIQSLCDAEFFSRVYLCLCDSAMPPKTGTAPAFSKLFKRLCRQYFIRDRCLYHRSGNTERLVLLSRERQTSEVITAHVCAKTGVHFGVKRMFAKLKYYWRAIYRDMLQHVRRCAACSEDVADTSDHPATATGARATGQLCPTRLSGQLPALPRPHINEIRVAVYRSSVCVASTWFVLFICMDTGYLHARSRQFGSGAVATTVTSATMDCCDAKSTESIDWLALCILECFCLVGFPAVCSIFGCEKDVFLDIKNNVDRMRRYDWPQMSSGADDIFDSISLVEFRLLEDNQFGCEWALKVCMLNSVSGFSTRCTNVDHSVDRQSNTASHLFTFEWLCACQMRICLHNRQLNPVGVATAGADVTPARDKAPLETDGQAATCCQDNGSCQTQHCRRLATAKIVRRAAKLRRELRTRYKDKVVNVSQSSSLDLDGPREDLIEPAIVSSLTDGITSKLCEHLSRGKYRKYSDELRRKMALYAIKYGYQKTIDYYSRLLGWPVAKTTVRNFVRHIRRLTPDRSKRATTMSQNARVTRNKSMAAAAITAGASVVGSTTQRDGARSSCGDLSIEISKVDSGRQPKTTSMRQGSSGQSSTRAANKRPLRGVYATYSPEMRAMIGSYAVQYNNSATIAHFEPILGVRLPESTIRNLKRRYQRKAAVGCRQNTASSSSTTTTTTIGYSARGRPLRLGKHEKLVQECVSKLAEEGVRLNARACVTVATHVLEEQEPSLLRQNGGHVTLDIPWAKSFMRRNGL